MNTLIISDLHRKLKYISQLIIKTPNFGWIISLQVLSGFLTVAGIPMLIPVLEYTRTDSATGDKSVTMDLFSKILKTLGVEPSFYKLLFLASLLIDIVFIVELKFIFLYEIW